eukprot:jgi/Chlat1/5810/Chrsp4S06272
MAAAAVGVPVGVWRCAGSLRSPAAAGVPVVRRPLRHGVLALPQRRLTQRRRVATSASLVPQHVTDVLYQLAALPEAAADAAGQAAATATDATAGAAAAAAANSGGFWSFISEPLEVFLKVLESGLEKVGVPYSYGFSIILLTILVKAITFPLSQKQIESTQKVQALQPQIKALQARYKDDQERLQVETARLYRTAEVNPLAGCLPTLVTLPLWIGLYRALTNAANEGVLDAGFFWIPSLAGPTTLADRTAGLGNKWLFPFIDGAPPIGWQDAIAYLVLPVVLVISTYVSQKFVSPTPTNDSKDAGAQTSAALLKFIPLMVGYFSLNVPAGLTLYWVTNNVLTTAQTLYFKKKLPAPAAAETTTLPGTAKRGGLPAASSGNGAGVGASARESAAATARGQRFAEQKRLEEERKRKRKEAEEEKKRLAEEAATRAADESSSVEKELHMPDVGVDSVPDAPPAKDPMPVASSASPSPSLARRSKRKKATAKKSS